MKQNITLDDLNQLSDKGRKGLREWWETKWNEGDFDLYFAGDHERFDIDECLPLLSIGQMIEFLEDEWMRICVFNKSISPIYYRKGSWSIDKLCTKHEDFPCYEQGCTNNTDSFKELCDALWSACVEVLNRE